MILIIKSLSQNLIHSTYLQNVKTQVYILNDFFTVQWP